MIHLNNLRERGCRALEHRERSFFVLNGSCTTRVGWCPTRIALHRRVPVKRSMCEAWLVSAWLCLLSALLFRKPKAKERVKRLSACETLDNIVQVHSKQDRSIMVWVLVCSGETQCAREVIGPDYQEQIKRMKFQLLKCSRPASTS